MSFPVVLDNTVPADTETPQLGAARIRALTQDFLDLFTLTNGASIAWAVLDGVKGIFPAVLTNKTGTALVAGDVVGLDTGNNTAVALADTQSTLVKLAVAQASIADGASGPFVLVGRTVVNVQGAATRGNYLRKSATTKKVEDAGVAMGATTTPASGVQGVFTTADSGGQATAILFGQPQFAALESGTWSADLGPSGTGVRAMDTVYQNTGGKMRRVAFRTSVGDNNNQYSAQVGSANPPTLTVGWGGPNNPIGAATKWNTLFLVPNNWYWKVQTDAGSVTMSALHEMDE